MKTRMIPLLAALGFFTSSWALASDGRMSLMVRTQGGGGPYAVEVRQEGNRIVGRSTFSSDSGISLQVGGGTYQGSAAGGYTDLSCSVDQCQGVIGDKSARFSIAVDGSQRGSVNFNRLRVERTAESIVIRSAGMVELVRTAPGVYEGQGFLGRSPGSAMRAVLKTSGSLQDLRDPALLTILLAAPFTAR